MEICFVANWDPNLTCIKFTSLNNEILIIITKITFTFIIHAPPKLCFGELDSVIS